MSSTGPQLTPPNVQGPPVEPTTSRRWLLVLGLMLAAMWFWKSRMEGSENPPIAYSQLFDWGREAKLESVIIAGEAVDATLKKPESLEGRTVKTFHSNLPQSDPAFLPMLRDKGVQITVKSQQQPFAIQLVMTLLPWALIIGAWIWMSRRARGMLSTGGPLGSLTKS